MRGSGNRTEGGRSCLRLLEKSPHPDTSFCPENDLPWAEEEEGRTFLALGDTRESSCTCLTQAPASPSLRHFSGGSPGVSYALGEHLQPWSFSWSQPRAVQIPPHHTQGRVSEGRHRWGCARGGGCSWEIPALPTSGTAVGCLDHPNKAQGAALTALGGVHL